MEHIKRRLLEQCLQTELEYTINIQEKDTHDFETCFKFRMLFHKNVYIMRKKNEEIGDK